MTASDSWLFESHLKCKHEKYLLASTNLAETLGEALDTTASVHHFLSAGVEWVTLGANFNVQVFAQSRASLNLVTTGAGNFDFFVIRMDFRLHGIYLKTMRAATRSLANSNPAKAPHAKWSHTGIPEQ